MSKLDDFLKENPPISDSRILSEKDLGQVFGGGLPGNPGCNANCGGTISYCNTTCSGTDSASYCLNGCYPSCSGSLAGRPGVP